MTTVILIILCAITGIAIYTYYRPKKTSKEAWCIASWTEDDCYWLFRTKKSANRFRATECTPRDPYRCRIDSKTFAKLKNNHTIIQEFGNRPEKISN